MKVRIETMEDLWSLQRVLFAGDIVRSESERKFKPEDGSKGELKKVFITLQRREERAGQERVAAQAGGKIVDGEAAGVRDGSTATTR